MIVCAKTTNYFDSFCCSKLVVKNKIILLYALKLRGVKYKKLLNSILHASSKMFYYKRALTINDWNTSVKVIQIAGLTEIFNEDCILLCLQSSISSRFDVENLRCWISICESNKITSKLIKYLYNT